MIVNLPLFIALITRQAAPSAEFSVDQTHHLMSFLTMLGPSPDWNVGLSGEDLCTKDCGWVQKFVADLIPWDAGTDSGVTYEVWLNVVNDEQGSVEQEGHGQQGGCPLLALTSQVVVDLGCERVERIKSLLVFSKASACHAGSN